MSLRSAIFVAVQIAAILYLALTGPVVPDLPVFAALALLGLILIVWGIVALRVHNWNVAPETRQGATLIRSGPYRYVRHPIYSGGLLVTLMWLTASFTWTRWAVWVVLVADLVLKAQWEEKLLVRSFPDYPDYMTKTKALIPFIY